MFLLEAQASQQVGNVGLWPPESMTKPPNSLPDMPAPLEGWLPPYVPQCPSFLHEGAWTLLKHSGLPLAWLSPISVDKLG